MKNRFELSIFGESVVTSNKEITTAVKRLFCSAGYFCSVKKVPENKYKMSISGKKVFSARKEKVIAFANFMADLGFNCEIREFITITNEEVV